jgi:hypothetical protein
MSMIIAMIGTAVTPLITALQKSALIGLRRVKLTKEGSRHGRGAD